MTEQIEAMIARDENCPCWTQGDGAQIGHECARDEAAALLSRAREFEESVHCPNGADYRCPFKSCKRCRGLAEIDTYLEGR